MQTEDGASAYAQYKKRPRRCNNIRGIESLDRYRLLTGGGEAFAEILRQCGSARRSIYVNMFIWRDDAIGTRLGEALLLAARRGVKVTVIKDKFGGAYELAEESGRSFWHGGHSPLLRTVAAVLRLCMPANKRVQTRAAKYNETAAALAAHPNVITDTDRYRFDHTKFYIFDERVLIFGGVNVEDKEVEADVTGAVYHDFMIVTTGEDEAAKFRRSFTAGYTPQQETPVYVFNAITPRGYINGILPAYLDFIGSAKYTLSIMMPYIGDRRIEKALLTAAMRGVSICLILPQQANMQHDLNMYAAERLYSLSNGKIKVMLTPLMCHAKMMIADGCQLTLGSANLNRDGVSRGWQLNCFITEAAAVKAAADDFAAVLSGAAVCRDFVYSPLPAHLEAIMQR